MTRTITNFTLFGDEELLHDIQPSWLAFWKSLSTIALVTVVTAGFGLPLFYIPYAKWKNTRYVITTDRIIRQEGSWKGNTTTEYRIENVDQITSKQGTLEALRNRGTIEFTMRERGFEDRIITLSGVPNYEAVRDSIRQAQHESRKD